MLIPREPEPENQNESLPKIGHTGLRSGMCVRAEKVCYKPEGSATGAGQSLGGVLCEIP